MLAELSMYYKIPLNKKYPIMAENTFIARFAEFETPEKGAKFGIAKVTEFIQYIAEIVPHLADVTSDDSISWFEALGLLSPAIKGGRLLLNLRQIGEELQDLDIQEKDQLIALLKETPAFKFKRSAEMITFLDKTANMVIYIWNLFKEGKDLLAILRAK